MTQHLHGDARTRLIATVTAHYLAGATIRQVAAEVGYSYTAVRNMLLNAGVTLRPKRGAAVPGEPSGDPLAVACPRCRMPAGRPCIQPSCRPCPAAHKARGRAAAKVGR